MTGVTQRVIEVAILEVRCDPPSSATAWDYQPQVGDGQPRVDPP